MRKRKLLTILLALAVAVSGTVMMSGCGATVIHQNGTSASTDTAADDTDDTNTTTNESGEEESSEDESSEEESSEDESSEEESSEDESSEEESSEDESSEEESSEDESSEEESSEEESSEDESSEEASADIPENAIKFVKPDDWSDNVNVFIYNKDQKDEDNNGAWPGVAMTQASDGTYYYEVDAKFEGYKLIFNDAEKPQRHLLPKSDGFTVEAGKTYDADSE